MLLTPTQGRTLLLAALAALILWVLSALGAVLAPFAAATILAYALQPAVAWLRRRGLPAWLATSIVLLAALLVLVAILLVLVPIVRIESLQVRERLPALAARLTGDVLPWVNQISGLDLRLDAQALREWIASHLAGGGDELAAAALSWARSGGNALLQIAGFAFLLPVVVFYLLLDWDGWLTRLRHVLPPRWQRLAQPILHEIDGLLGQYLRGQLLVMLALAVFYSLALLLAGFHLWLPIGVLTGLLIAIPYLGFALGLVFALLSGMLQMGPLHGLVACAIVFGLGQVLESLWLTPRLVGERIGLHPLAVILALMVFGALFGFVGVLVALPLAAVTAVLGRHLLASWRASDFFQRP